MLISPAALPEDTLLSERFLLKRVLGRGGFSIAYLAEDLQRKDVCVVKELAPGNARREPDGMLDLGDPEASQHLRQRFLDEARTLNAMRLRGVLPSRQAFVELGTAYFVTDHLPDAETLQDILRREGPLDTDGALDVLMQLLEILEAVHAKGILHRDIKPSNVLVDRRGEVTLIDFGSAREWHADVWERHTLVFTPGYAAPEQHSERARRGPATDVYGLCATTFHMLVGEPPPTATERAAGLALPSLLRLNPALEVTVAQAIEAGLALRYEDRPQSVRELRERLLQSAQVEDPRPPIEVYDEQRLRLKTFAFEKRQCPACGGLLESPKPLRLGTCPVCHGAAVAKRAISEKLCPECRSGSLHLRTGSKGPCACPACGIGLLDIRRRGVLRQTLVLECPECGETLTQSGENLVQESTGLAKPPKAWIEDGGRSNRIWCCDGCDAQFDETRDGRRRQVLPPPSRWVVLYPEEWARVAAGLDPGAGNAECPACQAEFFLEDGAATLLTAPTDPYGFGQSHIGRHHPLSRLRWLAVGKESPNPGLRCLDCGTELDQEGTYFRLVQSRNPRLAAAAGTVNTLGDWHRMAQHLPAAHEEDAFEARFDELIRQGYRSGELPFDSRSPRMRWRGPARRLETTEEGLAEGPAGTLMADDSGVSFGGMIRRWRVPLDAILAAVGKGEVLQLSVSGEREPAVFALDPITFEAEFRSGRRRIELTAEDLAALLTSG